MSEHETTTEMLAEIEGQATEYTPPEGWRVLAVGEKLQPGDMTVRSDGYCYSTERVGYFVGDNQRYIRRIGPEPEPQPQPEPQPVQVREGRWRTRNGLVRNVTAMPTNHEDFAAAYPWWDGVSTWKNNGRWLADGSTYDLVKYLGPLEEQPQPQHNGLVRDVTHQLQESGVLDSAKAEQQIEELRSEVSYVQRLLGESRQRVTQLEELVGSLRTINEAQEKSVRLAGQANTDLQHRLDVVAAEWAEQAATINGLQQQVENRQQEYDRQKSRIEFLETLNAGNGAAIEDYRAKVEKLQSLVDTARQQLEASATECDSVTTRLEAVAAERDQQTDTIRRLQIELDAAQQVPQAVSDRFEEGWDAGTARAVETIAEWLEPIRAVDSEHLANETLQHMPQIMRHLTGLTPED